MKFLKNKFVIGITCIIIAVLVVIFLMPKASEEQITIVKLTSDITSNTCITENMVKEVSLPKESVSTDAIKEKDKVIGKYSTTNIYSDDFITSAKLSDTPTNANLYALNEGEEALSVLVSDLAASVSGKLMEGDVITMYYYDDTSKEVYQDEILKHLEVLSVSNADAQDVTSSITSETNDDNIPATITLKVNSQQAALLVQMENNGKLYASFIARGDKAATILGKNVSSDTENSELIASTETNPQ